MCCEIFFGYVILEQAPSSSTSDKLRAWGLLHKYIQRSKGNYLMALLDGGNEAVLNTPVL